MKMTVSNRKAILQSDIYSVWETVLGIDDYSKWRSDLSKTEVVNEKQFVEYTKKGYPTTFTVTAAEPYKRWEFDMENGNMKGHWIGIFTAKGTETEIDFTEYVTGKNIFLKPFVSAFLKKQQARYVADLMKALSR